MDWNRVEGNWGQISGKIKERWGNLTEDDLTYVNGNRERLEAKLQERYGIAADQVRQDIDEWYNTQKSVLDTTTNKVSAAFDNFHNLGTQQFEAVTATAGSITRSWQEITAETADFSRRTIAAHTDFLGKLLGAKTLDHAIQVQIEFAKSTYEGFVAETAKIGELYARLAKEAFKPLETARDIAQAQITRRP